MNCVYSSMQSMSVQEITIIRMASNENLFGDIVITFGNLDRMICLQAFRVKAIEQIHMNPCARPAEN
jgi:hypothetical protein